MILQLVMYPLPILRPPLPVARLRLPEVCVIYATHVSLSP